MREIAICNDDFCNYAIIVSIKQLGDVAMRFRLVAFADEAAPDLAGQIEAMQENGVELLEIRGVDGQNIDGISATKAKVIRKMLGFSGLAVWSLGSPFGKIGINDDFVIISGNHFRKMVLSRGRRKTGPQTLSLSYSICCLINRTISILLFQKS